VQGSDGPASSAVAAEGDADGADRRASGRLRAALAETLALADVGMAPERLALVVAAVAVLAGVLAGVAVDPLAGVVAALAVPALARVELARRSRRRRTRFADQLADAVQAIAGAMRAGHGLSSSMAMVAHDVPEPAATEFGRVVAAERLGVPLDEALADAVRRTGSRDLENLGLVAALQRDVGGNGAEALDQVVETIRRRDDLRRLVATLTAQGRMSRWVLTALPVALGLVLFAIDSSFLSPLWHDGAGRVLGIAAIGLVVAGSYWIKRIVEIEV
jgi:tight adherence protein B